MTTFAYLRVSSEDQGESGLGLMAQQEICHKLMRGIRDPLGLAKFPDAAARGFFRDIRSAYRYDFFNRPAGQKMLAVLQPGDTIVMARLDRGFRNMRDFCNFMDLAVVNEWKLVCGDEQMDFTTANGRMVAKFYALMAEWESDIKSQRIKEALAAKKEGVRPVVREKDTAVSEPSEYRPRRPQVDTFTTEVLPGNIYVYIRCSHRSSVESGLGLRHQLNQCCDYAEALAELHPQLKWEDTVFTDPAVSALKMPVRLRPFGKQMNEQLKAGDVIVFTRPDRVFANINDMSNTLLDWKARGISIQFAESGLNLSSSTGEMVLAVLVAFAERERKLAANRAAESRRALESQGKFAGGSGYPPFWRIWRAGHSKTLIMDRQQILTFRALRMLIRHGYKRRQACERVEELVAKRENRPPIPLCGVERRGIWATLKVAPAVNGTLYPIWTVDRLSHAGRFYEDAIANWYAKPREERRRLACIMRGDFNRKSCLKKKTKKRD